MKKNLPPLGFIGDGQLALMLGESAQKQGFEFLAIGNDLDSSFARTFPSQYICAAIIDSASLTAFAKRCLAVTIENEFLSAELLAEVQNNSEVRLVPSPAAYRYFASKRDQKIFYETLGIPVAAWKVLPKNPDEILTQIEKSFRFPFILKASQGGYDGYGVRMVENKSQLSKALENLGHGQGREVLIEEKVSLKMELAQGALFDGRGGMILLPLVETIQKNGICEFVLSKPRLAPNVLIKVKQKIKVYFDKISGSGLDGLFNFEFFLTDGSEVLMNEGAPRPHNSQHLSVNASPLSQFDLLTRFLMDDAIPPGPSPLESRPGLMLNLLGKSTGTEYQLTLPRIPSSIEAYPKLYQKKECRLGRKMGHLNLIDPTGALNLLELGEQILKDYQL